MLERLYNYLLRNQVIFALFLIVMGWGLLHVRDILASLFFSYILMSALLPAVAFIKRNKVPHLPAVMIAYFTSIIILFLLIVPLIPFFTAQLQTLITRFPSYVDLSAKQLGLPINVKEIQNYITRDIGSLGSNAFFVTSQIFGGFFSVLTIFIVTFYLLLDHDKFKKEIAHLFKRDTRPHVLEVMQHIDDKLGSWVRGQILLSFSIGFLCWVALRLLNIPNALPLALLAGMLEAVPTIGPILSSIPALIVALTISPTLFFGVAIAYILIQFVENNLLVPKIMQRAVGLNPIVVIFAITAGASLMGIVGALLAIPFLSFLIVLFNSLENFEEN